MNMNMLSISDCSLLPSGTQAAPVGALTVAPRVAAMMVAAMMVTAMMVTAIAMVSGLSMRSLPFTRWLSGCLSAALLG